MTGRDTSTGGGGGGGGSGDSRLDDGQGIIPRSITHLFTSLQAGSDEIGRRRAHAAGTTGGGGVGRKGVWALRASYLEIYNEAVRDLLAPGSGNLSLRQSPGDGSFFCEGCLSVECHTLEDVLGVAEEAMKNRVVRAHALNADSSRSHAIFILQVEREILVAPTTASGDNPHQPPNTAMGPGPGGVSGSDPVPTTMRYGKLSFVDLAGSENLKQSKSSGAEAIKETASINKSLFTLGAVISLLSDVAKGRRAANSHIPFRNSVLTRLLMDSIAGRGMAMMIANCSPARTHAAETLRTLMYADRARNIRTKPTINNARTNASKDELILSLKRDVRALHLENAGLRNLLMDHRVEIPDRETLQRAVTTSGGPRRTIASAAAAGGGGAGGHGGHATHEETSEWMRLNSRGGTAFKSRPSMLSPGGTATAAAAGGPGTSAAAGGGGHSHPAGSPAAAPPVYTEHGELIPHEVVQRLRRLERAEKAAAGQVDQHARHVEQLQRQLQDQATETHQRVQEAKQQAQAQAQQHLAHQVAQAREQMRAEVRAEVVQQVQQDRIAAATPSAGGGGGVDGASDGGRAGDRRRGKTAAGGLSDSIESLSASDPMTEDAGVAALSLSSSPTSLHTANQALVHANRELRRMVRLLETGPDQGKDMSDDYEALSPNRRKAASETFALRKSNARLQKQLQVLQEHARTLEQEERRAEDEIARLNAQILTLQQQALEAAPSVGQLPSPQSPAHQHQQQPPSRVPLGELVSADKFGYGSMHQTLPGGARPTLSLAIPAPGRQPVATWQQGGPGQEVQGSQLQSSSSASLSGTYTSASVPSTTSAQVSTLAAHGTQYAMMLNTTGTASSNSGGGGAGGNHTHRGTFIPSSTSTAESNTSATNADAAADADTDADAQVHAKKSKKKTTKVKPTPNASASTATSPVAAAPTAMDGGKKQPPPSSSRKQPAAGAAPPAVLAAAAGLVAAAVAPSAVAPSKDSARSVSASLLPSHQEVLPSAAAADKPANAAKPAKAKVKAPITAPADSSSSGASPAAATVVASSPPSKVTAAGSTLSRKVQPSHTNDDDALSGDAQTVDEVTHRPDQDEEEEEAEAAEQEQPAEPTEELSEPTPRSDCRANEEPVEGATESPVEAEQELTAAEEEEEEQQQQEEEEDLEAAAEGGEPMMAAEENEAAMVDDPAAAADEDEDAAAAAAVAGDDDGDVGLLDDAGDADEVAAQLAADDAELLDAVSGTFEEFPPPPNAADDEEATDGADAEDDEDGAPMEEDADDQEQAVTEEDLAAQLAAEEEAEAEGEAENSPRHEDEAEAEAAAALDEDDEATEPTEEEEEEEEQEQAEAEAEAEQLADEETEETADGDGDDATAEDEAEPAPEGESADGDGAAGKKNRRGRSEAPNC